MAFYDKERLLDEANARMVAEYLGMDMQYRGSIINIKCPGHKRRLGRESGSYSACMLTEKGYHCFACNKQVSLINMVIEYEDLDEKFPNPADAFQEALGIIGDALGGRNLYTLDGDAELAEERSRALSADDLKIIGLEQAAAIDMIETVSNDKKSITSDGLIPKIPNTGMSFDAATYLGVSHKTFSVRVLKNEDPVAYNHLIKKAAKAAMEKYKNMIDACEHTSPKSKIFNIIKSQDKTNDEILYDFKHIYMDLYNRSKEIYMEVEDTEENVSMSEEIVEIPRYNLFD
jgi:hypothetical protein